MIRTVWRVAGWAGLALTAACGVSMAAVTNFYYVNVSNATPGSPYTSWGSAATNIQDAVQQAEADLDIPGGTSCEVVVTDGVYRLTNQVTISKAITVRSFNGRAATVVDGFYPTYTNRCFFINANATLDGFTITNGSAFGLTGMSSRGGGVYAYACTSLIQNCTIIGNRASSNGVEGTGGGVAMTDGASVLQNCLVATNDTRGNGGSGTGVYVLNCAGRIVGCVISNNVQGGSNGSGAGLMMTLSPSAYASNCLFVANSCSRYGANYVNNGLITHSVISNNYARSAGGGVQLATYTGGSRLRDCTVVNNRTGGEGGGGVNINRGTIANTRIIGNYTSGNGGGVANNQGYLTNCLVAGNRADGDGGGMTRANNGETTVNCTFVANQARYGGGLYTVITNRPAHYLNVIVYGNSSTNSTAEDIDSSVPNWRDNWAFSCSPDLVAGLSNNLTADPLFRIGGSGFGTNATLGVYELRGASPCRDVGSNQTWMANAVDLIGNPRISPAGGRVDMGAFEGLPVIGMPGVLMKVD